ncbi:hypothetical protein JTB14_010867 [Gonioctena quinquepunctata]|nr:hypothetical protein JTB14_010867 [Gonioctena quinquepunctata]
MYTPEDLEISEETEDTEFEKLRSAPNTPTIATAIREITQCETFRTRIEEPTTKIQHPNTTGIRKILERGRFVLSTENQKIVAQHQANNNMSCPLPAQDILRKCMQSPESPDQMSTEYDSPQI